MKTRCYIIFLFLFLAPLIESRTGLDFIQAVDIDTFTCLHQIGISFVIPRVYTNLGYVDQVGINNIINAHAGGIRYIDAYLFPCVISGCPSTETQVGSVIDKISQAGTTFGTLWLDTERLNWPNDKVRNQQLIEQLVAAAKKRNRSVGIFTNYYNWESIVGLDYEGQWNLALWWNQYDSTRDFSNYKPFGGWIQPSIHQFNFTRNGPCGLTTDINYSP
ncbi:unnamed protein product [Caenorhabditis angaria]|uniref:Uncharacterized protein n=1 Tax=Caenorhabditis angaria TaxID=860376 RepID=A0A9P1IFX2_9PELO|nr:unnamed protein product [Caenorhabditis angaria]